MSLCTNAFLCAVIVGIGRGESWLMHVTSG